MSKIGEKKKGWATLFSGRIKDVSLMAVLAIMLFSLAFFVFREEENTGELVTAQMTEREQKVSRILQEIEGVGEASVVVCEDEDEVKSVVVVCEGANNLRVVMDIREAVAAALDTEQKSVKIYLKKDKRR